MSYGLGPNGFKRKTYEAIVTDMEARAKSVFGNDINFSVRSPLGIFIRVVAWFLGILWQLAEKVYFSAYVDTAEGTQLDYVAKYIGIQRRQAEKATGQIVITGTSGTVVPVGFLVAYGDIQFETLEEVTIGSDGTVTTNIEATQAGISGNVPANTITEIVTPIAGVDSVTNPSETSSGREKETDEELRDRYIQSVSKGGASTLDSIRASLLEVEGVRAALVVENNTSTTDSDGRPPKSIECYVLGGQSSDIAQTILNTKAAGIETYGTTTETVNDSAGNPHTIKFSYATEIPIYVNVNITKNDKYPSDGDELVRTEVIKYIGGTDADTTIYNGLGMGEDVILSKIIRACDSVDGIEDISVEISTDGVNFGTSNITINLAEVAETDYTKVVVTSA